MVQVLQRLEAAPEAFPAVPDGLSTAAAALNSDAIWQRIEGYVAHRWSEREVVWVVEGPGEFRMDLTPAVVSNYQIWRGSSYGSITLYPGPLDGLDLTEDGPYRITADVGAGPVPADAQEAFRRVAEYFAAEAGRRPGASSHAFTLGDGGLSESYERSPNWLARALINSGAGDLLRRYRRV